MLKERTTSEDRTATVNPKTDPRYDYPEIRVYRPYRDDTPSVKVVSQGKTTQSLGLHFLGLSELQMLSSQGPPEWREEVLMNIVRGIVYGDTSLRDGDTVSLGLDDYRIASVATMPGVVRVSQVVTPC